MSWDSVQVPRHCQCAFLWNWDTFKKLKWDQTVQTHPFLWSHKTVTLSTRNRKKWSWKDLSWWGYRAKDLKNELLLCVLFFFFLPDAQEVLVRSRSLMSRIQVAAVGIVITHLQPVFPYKLIDKYHLTGNPREGECICQTCGTHWGSKGQALENQMWYHHEALRQNFHGLKFGMWWSLFMW